MAAVTQVRILVTAVTLFFFLIFNPLVHLFFLSLSSFHPVLLLLVLWAQSFILTIHQEEAGSRCKRQWYSGEHSCLPSS